VRGEPDVVGECGGADGKDGCQENRSFHREQYFYQR
jgi:hypothetical protein